MEHESILDSSTYLKYEESRLILRLLKEFKYQFFDIPGHRYNVTFDIEYKKDSEIIYTILSGTYNQPGSLKGLEHLIEIVSLAPAQKYENGINYCRLNQI